MGSKLITKEKGRLHFVWVTNYYDFPLSGSCIHDNVLCRFEWDHENSDEDVVYNIYELILLEKIKWKIRQYLFELCIGDHCTYNGEHRTSYYKIKRPRWFWGMVFTVYFKIKRQK